MSARSTLLDAAGLPGDNERYISWKRALETKKDPSSPKTERILSFEVGTVRADYWTGVTVALAVNGSVGAAAVVLCQMVLPAFTANARVPVVPNVCGVPVA